MIAPAATTAILRPLAISMAGEDGQQYVWGYVPVIVAKVGLYLKEHGACPCCGLHCCLADSSP